MYKKCIYLYGLMNLLLLMAFTCNQISYFDQVYGSTAYAIKTEDNTTSQYLSVVSREEASMERVIEYKQLNKTTISEKERDVLYRIVQAEAGGEDINGRILVANVILNRVKDEAFPNTISQVVFQKQDGKYQFSPIANGSYHEVTVSKETKEAVDRALLGEDLSQGALYFMARHASTEENRKWFDKHLTWLFRHGGHEFFS